MEKTKRGKKRFFSILASAIRITDFVLAGGGVFKNLVWLILAAAVGVMFEHFRHLTVGGWLVFFLAAVITRLVIEAALIALAAWVSQHLPESEDESF